MLKFVWSEAKNLNSDCFLRITPITCWRIKSTCKKISLKNYSACLTLCRMRVGRPVGVPSVGKITIRIIIMTGRDGMERNEIEWVPFVLCHQIFPVLKFQSSFVSFPSYSSYELTTWALIYSTIDSISMSVKLTLDFHCSLFHIL